MDLSLILNNNDPICAPTPPTEHKPLMAMQPKVKLQLHDMVTSAPLFHTFTVQSEGVYNVSRCTRYNNISAFSMQHQNHSNPSSFPRELGRIFKDKRRLSSNEGRSCISCGSSSTNMWRPAWNGSSGKLCNPCGLRYYRRRIRCTNPTCELVPRYLEVAPQVNLTKNAKGTACPRCKQCLKYDAPLDT